MTPNLWYNNNMTNTVVMIQSPILQMRSNTNHFHYDSDKTWKERDMCAHHNLIAIQCDVSVSYLGQDAGMQKEFICGDCGVGANPDMKPEPRTEQWYREREQLV